MPYFRKTSPSVALTGKDSQYERISIASRSFIFWPIGKIRLQKKVGSKIFENFWNLKSEILKSEIWKFWNLKSENFEIWKFWNLKVLVCDFPEILEPTFFWRRIFQIGQKINDRLAMETRSFLEPFPVGVTEGEVFRKYQNFVGWDRHTQRQTDRHGQPRNHT